MASVSDYYTTQPYGAPAKVGDIPASQGGATPPPPPPAVNSNTAGAPTQAKPITGPPPGTVTGPPADFRDGGRPISEYRPGPNDGTYMPTPAGAVGAWTPGATSTPAPAGPSTPTTPAPLYGSGLNDELTNWYKSIIGGKDSIYSPEAMGRMKGDLFDASQGQADTAINQAKQDAVSRGMFRSGLPTDAILQARANAGSAYSHGLANLESTAAQQNSQQKMSALGALQQALSSDRDFQLKTASANRPVAGPNYDDEMYGLLSSLAPPSFG